YKPERRQVTISKADVTLNVALPMIAYKLTVQAVPVDSRIEFEKNPLEYRPGMELAPGSYDLVVSHEGYKPERRQVTISKVDVMLHVTSPLNNHKLTVQPTPADSRIKFEKNPLEYRPGMELAPGSYPTRLTPDRYKPERRQVTISKADVTLDVPLPKITY